MSRAGRREKRRERRRERKKDCISKHIKNEVERVVQDKYGVNNVFKLEETKQKIKQTNLERYNVEYAAQNEEIKQKIKQTNLNKYGTHSPYPITNKTLSLQYPYLLMHQKYFCNISLLHCSHILTCR